MVLSPPQPKLHIGELDTQRSTTHFGGNLSKSALIRQFEEQCEAERRISMNQLDETIARDQETFMKKARERGQHERERELNAVLIQKECEREAELEHLRQENEAATQDLCNKLKRNLEQENQVEQREFAAHMQVRN